MELLVVLNVWNVEKWDYVTGVISASSTPAHFTLTVSKLTNEPLAGHCSGWGCASSPSPLPWWPCSPKLSTPDSLCTNFVL